MSTHHDPLAEAFQRASPEQRANVLAEVAKVSERFRLPRREGADLISTTTFGEQLRTWRHDAGLTQAQLAEQTGINHTYLSHMEAGRTVPSIDVLLALACALNVPTPDMCRASGRLDRYLTREELEQRVLFLEDLLRLTDKEPPQ